MPSADEWELQVDHFPQKASSLGLPEAEQAGTAMARPSRYASFLGKLITERLCAYQVNCNLRYASIDASKILPQKQCSCLAMSILVTEGNYHKLWDPLILTRPNHKKRF